MEGDRRRDRPSAWSWQRVPAGLIHFGAIAENISPGQCGRRREGDDADLYRGCHSCLLKPRKCTDRWSSALGEPTINIRNIFLAEQGPGERTKGRISASWRPTEGSWDAPRGRRTQRARTGDDRRCRSSPSASDRHVVASLVSLFILPLDLAEGQGRSGAERDETEGDGAGHGSLLLDCRGMRRLKEARRAEDRQSISETYSRRAGGCIDEQERRDHGIGGGVQSL